MHACMHEKGLKYQFVLVCRDEGSENDTTSGSFSGIDGPEDEQ